VTIRLGLQIANFSYGTGVAEIFPTVIAQAKEAEAAGFDSVFVMDAGIDGVILSPLTHVQGYEQGRITAVGEALKPLVSA
jgi:hypothetical protein